VVAAIRAMASSRRWRAGVAGADIVFARNLEMLAIAVVVRGRIETSPPIVYECLDIHRLMTRGDWIGAVLRWIEGRLLRSTTLLVTSSPRFIGAYFERFHRVLPPWIVLENKLLADEVTSCRKPIGALPPGPPWRIGWFGVIRCRQSLALLADLVRLSGGRVEVEIRGRPARDVIADFDSVITQTPGLYFGGPYDRATELGSLYGRVHFSWAIDFYEEGQNSDWLLPNRLYEGSAFGAVPLALANVETGRWLERHGCGILLAAPLDETLQVFFQGLSQAIYGEERARVLGLPRSDLIETGEAAVALTARLRQLAHMPGLPSSVLQDEAA
jgi:succinoglycan biosynthesis protein ExoL